MVPFSYKVEKKLNLGCGVNSLKGFVNLDKVKLKGVDVVHDLEVFPYPFKDNIFSYIKASNVLEHLSDLTKIMEELHRISKDKCIIDVVVPYFNFPNAYSDPTHKRFFTLDSFGYFTEEYLLRYYSKCRLKVLSRKLKPTKMFKFIPNFLLNKVGVAFGGVVRSIEFKLQIVK